MQSLSDWSRLITKGLLYGMARDVWFWRVRNGRDDSRGDR